MNVIKDGNNHLIQLTYHRVVSPLIIISSQCSEPSSIDNIEDPYQHVRISVDEPSMKQQPEAASLRGSTGHNSDQGSSASEEDWDESDIEIADSITNENHSQAKSFIKWIAALILGFQAAYVLP